MNTEFLSFSMTTTSGIFHAWFGLLTDAGEIKNPLYERQKVYPKPRRQLVSFMVQGPFEAKALSAISVYSDKISGDPIWMILTDPPLGERSVVPGGISTIIVPIKWTQWKSCQSIL